MSGMPVGRSERTRRRGGLAGLLGTSTTVQCFQGPHRRAEGAGEGGEAAAQPAPLDHVEKSCPASSETCSDLCREFRSDLGISSGQ